MSSPADEGSGVTACELSVVIPCLNEAETLETCIRKAIETMRRHAIAGEVVVADNGSDDGSDTLARRAGARVVAVRARGYGNALMDGIEAARGRFVIMGDADESYDFGEIPAFLERLRQGFDLVQGCRLPAGGGRVLPGAMPWSHRRLGNPFFSRLARVWFRAPIHDVYCGMRGFSRTAYRRWSLRCTGMEFATEMIIKASLFRDRIAEVPITLHPDGRRARKPHLKTFHDGWRTLRFFMISCPRRLFLLPGLLLILAGIAGGIMGAFNLRFLGVTLDVHTLLVSALLIILGYQSVLFAAFTLIFAIREHFLPPDPRVARLCRWITMERALALGAIAFLAGLALLGAVMLRWWRVRFGPLDYRNTMRCVIAGVLLAALGFQSILSGAFISILGMHRK